MKKIIILAALLICSACAFAQGVRYDNVATLDTGRPAQGIGIRVCSSGSTGTPCTPTASIFSDSGLASAITQPGLQTDQQGNYNFYALCGKYDIQVSGNGVTTKTMKDVQVGPCGIPSGQVDKTALSANLGSTTLYATPSNGGGFYRVTCYTVVTTAATTSSTLPSCAVFWTDTETGIAQSTLATNTSTANTVGLVGSQNRAIIHVTGGNSIAIASTGYVSSGATAMKYSVHARLEFLGQ
jgi:hypothetical protein